MVNISLIRKNITCDRNFKLADSVDILMIGDSHVGLSLNPQYIPHSDNQFQIGEPYFYTYIRLKRFLKENPQIKYLILGFTYANLSANYDEPLFESSQKNAYFPKIFMLLNNDEIKTLHAKDLIFYRNFLGWQYGFPTKDNVPLIIKTISGNYDARIMPYRGEFFSTDHVMLDTSYYKAVKLHFDLKEYKTSSLQIEYLNKIIELSKSHDIKLILYASPLYDKYFDLIPDSYKMEYAKLQNELMQNPDIHFVNYLQLDLPSSCFSDANHTNTLGAEIVSKKFYEMFYDTFLIK